MDVKWMIYRGTILGNHQYVHMVNGLREKTETSMSLFVSSWSISLTAGENLSFQPKAAAGWLAVPSLHPWRHNLAIDFQ
jgi:hypothetical protein